MLTLQQLALVSLPVKGAKAGQSAQEVQNLSSGVRGHQQQLEAAGAEIHFQKIQCGTFALIDDFYIGKRSTYSEPLAVLLLLLLATTFQSLAVVLSTLDY